MNDRGDCRTAPATPGLLISLTFRHRHTDAYYEPHVMDLKGITTLMKLSYLGGRVAAERGGRHQRTAAGED